MFSTRWPRLLDFLGSPNFIHFKLDLVDEAPACDRVAVLLVGKHKQIDGPSNPSVRYSAISGGGGLGAAAELPLA